MPKTFVVLASLLALIPLLSSISAQGEGGRIRSGQAIYDEHCARCHGLIGHGDGPDASSPTVPPANFHSARSRSKTDIELFTATAYGSAFSPMHGRQDRLTDEEIMEVIGYLRSVAPFDPNLRGSSLSLFHR